MKKKFFRSRFPTNPTIKPMAIPSWQLQDKQEQEQAETLSNGDAEKSAKNNVDCNENVEKMDSSAPDIIV